jgi:hypothetical protein
LAILNFTNHLIVKPAPIINILAITLAAFKNLRFLRGRPNHLDYFITKFNFVNPPLAASAIAKRLQLDLDPKIAIVRPSLFPYINFKLAMKSYRRHLMNFPNY